jgi:hypothetical protein
VFGWEDRERCKEFITPERIVEAAKSFAATYAPDSESDEAEARDIADSLDPGHVIVDHSEMHYGMKEKNPLEFVKFYSKRNPDSEISPTSAITFHLTRLPAWAYRLCFCWHGRYLAFDASCFWGDFAASVHSRSSVSLF